MTDALQHLVKIRNRRKPHRALTKLTRREHLGSQHWLSLTSRVVKEKFFSGLYLLRRLHQRSPVILPIRRNDLLRQQHFHMPRRGR